MTIFLSTLTVAFHYSIYLLFFPTSTFNLIFLPRNISYFSSPNPPPLHTQPRVTQSKSITKRQLALVSLFTVDLMSIGATIDAAGILDPSRQSHLNLLKPNDIYIYMSYRSANLQTLHFKYVFNKYTY